MKVIHILLFVTLSAMLMPAMAQHPRVCDYVSLKHALKGKEYNVNTLVHDDGGLLEIKHEKEELRIEAISKFGKEIDSLNLIKYKNDTVFILLLKHFATTENISLKSLKGAYNIYDRSSKKFILEKIDIGEPYNSEEQFKEMIDSAQFIGPNVFPMIFAWNGIEGLLKDIEFLDSEDNYILTRLIFKDYKMIHIDRWHFGIPFFSHKVFYEIRKKYGLRTDNTILENKIVHTYDTISKKDNDKYFGIMQEDENELIVWRKKGITGFHTYEIDNLDKILYKEPDKNSEQLLKFEEYDDLIIYDAIGFWYYVWVKDDKGREHWGWIKTTKGDRNHW